MVPAMAANAGPRPPLAAIRRRLAGRRSPMSAYPGAKLEMDEAQAAVRTLSLDVDLLQVGSAEEIAPAFGTLKSSVQALYVCPPGHRSPGAFYWTRVLQQRTSAHTERRASVRATLSRRVLNVDPMSTPGG